MEKKRVNQLIFLCWLAYAMAYIGRLNYSANLIHIVEDLNITKAQGGSIASLFFFSYGAGQVVHGLLNKYYNPRWAIALSLILSSLLNLLMPFCKTLLAMQVVWLLNGFSQAVLWSTLTRVLGIYLKGQYIQRSILVMGTTVAAGTVLSYGIGALLHKWQNAFYVAFVVLFVVGVTWFAFFNRITKDLEPHHCKQTEEKKQSIALPKHLLVLLGVIFIFAILNNLIKDGLTTWTPSVFYELFGLPDTLSILLTLGLPMVAFLGSSVCLALHKKFRDYVFLCGIFYFVTFIAMGIMILLLPQKSWVITLACFILCSLMMSAINNLITSLFPLEMRDYMDCGKIAGICNAFCYVGSTISTYALGAIADTKGWNGVFYLLLFLTVAALLICGIYLPFRNKINVDK